MIIPARRLPLLVASAAAIGGTLVATYYYSLGLTLSHYDARGHLIVARRIFDSITPGWQQIGAVWLPLPHVLNAVPVQVDAFYRTGASAVAISIVAFALATAALAWMIVRFTGSKMAAIVGAAVFALNPNVLYLQATPMSEPLLLGLTILAVALLVDWCDKAGPEAGNSVVGWAFALACLTRYEAWPVTACALMSAVWDLRASGENWRDAIRRVGAIAIYPVAAIALFCVFSRIVIGKWFVAGGFFVPENVALGHPLLAAEQILWGVRMVGGLWLTVLGLVGLGLTLALSLVNRRRGAMLIPLSLVATAGLPWLAFVQGHPYRIRYMVPLIAAEAFGVGVAAGLVKRGRTLAIAVVMVLAAFELRPFDQRAPMVVEAQWDRPNMVERQAVTDYLHARYGGETIMASMGSLGHYMQEMSHSGFRVQDFLHEGNGEIWKNALHGARPYAGWVLIEERAEGGDMLAEIVRKNPKFLDGFSRVAEGAGVVLYRRDPVLPTSPLP